MATPGAAIPRPAVQIPPSRVQKAARLLVPAGRLRRDWQRYFWVRVRRETGRSKEMTHWRRLRQGKGAAPVTLGWPVARTLGCCGSAAACVCPPTGPRTSLRRS